MRLLILIAVLSLTACKDEVIERDWRSNAHMGMLKLCLSDEVISEVNGEPKYWRDTKQCQEALNRGR